VNHHSESLEQVLNPIETIIHRCVQSFSCRHACEHLYSASSHLINKVTEKAMQLFLCSVNDRSVFLKSWLL